MQVRVGQARQDDAPFHILLLGVWILGQKDIGFPHGDDAVAVDQDRRFGWMCRVLSINKGVIKKFHFS
jgi:hypothetical protein